MSDKNCALLFGDISGPSGLRTIYFDLKSVAKKYSPSIIIANGENSEGGYGVSQQSISKIFESGVNVITSGNHAFDNASGVELYDSTLNLLRPENFMSGNPGKGWCIFSTNDSLQIAVLNLHVPSGIQTVENLYTSADKAINKIRKTTPIIFVDLHGEYAYQKEAFAFEFDGRVTAVCGTHTHVQTMDEKILKGGTAYITDIGMCGANESVIGADIQSSIKKMNSGVPIKMPVVEAKECILQGVAIYFDKVSGKANAIERINYVS